MSVLPVIIAGGSGTRLWPLSSGGFPKQFLSLGNKETLFQKACLRTRLISSNKSSRQGLVIVTNEEYRFLAKEQLREINFDSTLLLEPESRNTAPAMTLASLYAQELDDPILFVMPADHIIQDEHSFQLAALKAIEYAKENIMVILGITPTSANSGYGYIKTNLENGKVERFVEKPDEFTAKQYLENGNYYWNAGIFILRASLWLNILKKFRSDIETATKIAWQNYSSDGCFLRPDKNLFSKIPSESIDYAVIEKLPSNDFPIKMVPLDAGWNDLGSWDAVWKMEKTDTKGNAMKGEVVCIDSKNSYIDASSRMVGVLGVNNLVVIETVDAVLVADKDLSNDVKKIVDQIKAEDQEKYNSPRKVSRPWGWFDVIDTGHQFKVKRIHVKPGARLSLQKHNYRAEHWIVVKGNAMVTCGDKTFTITENQSTYIPLGEVHRLENKEKTPLEIIEVQSGTYLGEDDIVRLEDEYGR